MYALRNLLAQALARFDKLDNARSKMHSMPKFWQNRSSIASIMPDLLMPVAVIYYFICLYRQRNVKTEKLPVPVICVGNTVAGGAGKTPVVIALAKMLSVTGKQIAFVSRGYLGELDGQAKVDLTKHTAKQVGDEAIMLAKIAPVFVGANRLLAAKMAVEDGAQIILMDDGLQNNSIYKDLSLNVVDGGFGFGNGFTIPAGPLREPLPAIAKKTAASIIIGEDVFQSEAALRKYAANIINARIKLSNIDDLKDKNILAFAGIGRPGKFFDSLRASGIYNIEERGFPDHYIYTTEDIAALKNEAKLKNLQLVTTEKDATKLPAEFLQKTRVIPAEIEFLEQKKLEILLRPFL